MRGDRLDINRLYSFAESTRGVNAYAYTTDHLWIGHHLRFGHTKASKYPNKAWLSLNHCSFFAAVLIRRVYTECQCVCVNVVSRTKGSKCPNNAWLSPGDSSSFPQLPAHILESPFYFCISCFHRPTLLAVYLLSVMDSHSPPAASADPSWLRAAALYRPPSNSQIPVDGNHSNADAPNLLKIIDKVGHPVGPILDEIA